MLRLLIRRKSMMTSRRLTTNRELRLSKTTRRKEKPKKNKLSSTRELLKSSPVTTNSNPR